MTALAVRDLTVSYGLVPAVQELSFSIPASGLVTIIGPNGAGKSTTLNAIMGLLPSSGGVALGDTPIAALGPEQRVALGLALVPETRELFATMSVEDNLRLGAYARRGKHDAAAELGAVYAAFPRLRERSARAAGTLSGGERQMLALGRALMSKPRVLMLDEPSLGLAPLVVRDMFAIIARLKQSGVAILLVEQNARAALMVADYAYVLELGRIVREGPAASMLSDDSVLRAYLGPNT